MKFCTECGSEIPKNSKFCPNCGTPVVRAGKKEPATHTPQPETGSGTKLNAGNLYGRLNLEKLPEGHLIDDRYEIIRKLGQGGFGAVYLANDLKMEMHKVLKVIPEVISNDKKAMVLLRKEASIMAKLNHKNIVRVYDFHDNGDINYIDMEYVEGQSLADLLLKAPENKLPEEEVKKYAIQIAEGLAYAHNQRVIHKDIKPQNIMRTNDGTIKLMDFGIAETVHSSMSRLKNTGSSGTLVYMSPEQLRGKDVGKESDIYSLGATLYELLTGNPPFYQGDITYQIINETPKPIEGISQQMNDVVLKCLEKDLRKRFGNCKELYDALKNPEKFLKNKTVKIKEQHESATSKSHNISDNAGGKKRQTWVPWTIFLFLIAAGMVSYFLFFASSRKAKQVSKTGETKITKSMIKDSTAKLIFNLDSGEVVVKTTNKNMKEIKNFIEKINHVYNQQLEITVDIYEFVLNRDFNFGTDISGSSSHVDFATHNLLDSILTGSFKRGGDRGYAVDSNNKFIRYSKSYSYTQTMMNNISKTIAIQNTQDYVKSISSTTTTNTATTTASNVEVSSVNQGVSIDILPRIIGDKISLKSDIKINNLNEFKQSTDANGNTIFLPDTDSKTIPSHLIIGNGDKVLVGSYQDYQDVNSYTGIAPIKDFIIGGKSGKKFVKKEILVDIIEVKFNSGIMLVRYVLDLYGFKSIKTTMIDNTPFLKKYMNII